MPRTGFRRSGKTFTRALVPGERIGLARDARGEQREEAQAHVAGQRADPRAVISEDEDHRRNGRRAVDGVDRVEQGRLELPHGSGVARLQLVLGQSRLGRVVCIELADVRDRPGLPSALKTQGGCGLGMWSKMNLGCPGRSAASVPRMPKFVVIRFRACWLAKSGATVFRTSPKIVRRSSPISTSLSAAPVVM